MGRWDMGWDTLLVMYVSAGVLGSALLLWALWAYVFRPVFAP